MPEPGTIGNAPLDCMRAPGVFDTDFSIFKETAISEVRAQFRAEFFNIFNNSSFQYHTTARLQAWVPRGTRSSNKTGLPIQQHGIGVCDETPVQVPAAASTQPAKVSPIGVKSDTLVAPVTNIQGYSIHDGPGIRTVVFLKGCGLACNWCANPECVRPKPEVGFIESLCTRCGNCIGVCAQEALSFDAEGLPHIDRSRCIACGECTSICCYHALVLHGKQMSVREVFKAIEADKMFYEASGGGVTASGGEPLRHPEFLCALFELCRAEGIHTCMETSGFANSSALLPLLPLID